MLADLSSIRVAHPLYGRTLVLNLPDTSSDDRTDATIAAMTALVKHTDVTQLAARVARRLGTHEAYRDYDGMIRSVFELLSPVERGGRVQFVRDIEGRELLRHPDQLLAEIIRHGQTACDCDDRAMVGVALLRAMGFRAGFVVVGRRASGPFHHVFFAVERRGRVVPLDPQETSAPGRWPPSKRKKIYWVE